MLRRRPLHSILLSLLLPGAVAALLWLAFPPPDPKPYSLVVTDREGRFLHAFRAPDGIWRLQTPPEEIPARLRALLIAREDRHFAIHPGVNPFSLLRAAAQNAAAGRRVSGASTITMQIARMLEPKERTVGGKVVEIFRAFQLELRYSKRELLEMYLSMVPLGGNIEGLKSAALMYYQTPLERLNTAQLLDLTLIPGNPNGLRPDRYPERLYAARIAAARDLLRRGLLDSSDSVTVWSSPAAAVRTELPRLAPHFALRVRDDVPGGSVVRGAVDLNAQLTVERLLAHHLQAWRKVGVHNGAVIVVENRSREVLAYAGSGDFGDSASAGQVNGARALRSPGSTLKPFLVAMEMDRGFLTPRTRLLDIPYDAEGYRAENYDGSYTGPVPADEALRRSLNVPMIRMLQQSGVGRFLDFAVNAGFPSLEPQRPRLGLSMILGGCGVTLEELAAAYASFPGEGIYAPLRFLHGAPPDAGREAFSASAACMVSEILSGVHRPDLPNNFESALNLPKIAFKTGTSYGRRDAWAIGYSAEHTVGVWIGNVTNQGNPDLAGSRAAAPLLVSVLNALSTSRRTTILPQPPDVGRRIVCAKSGDIPSPFCTETTTDLFSRSRTLARVCGLEQEFLVSPDRTRSYCPSCAGGASSVTEVFENHPPELRAWWMSVGHPAPAPPPHNPACTLVLAGGGPSILSPSDGMTYYLVSPQQKIVLQASPAADVRSHVWYVNKEYIGSRQPGEKVFFSFPAGRHSITCLDDRGRSTSVTVTVRMIL